MARPPQIPRALTRGPFTVEDARRSGLEFWHLRGASWTRLGSGTYLWSGLADDPMHRLVAAYRRLPEGAAFSGPTAAWLHGIDVPPCSPIDVTVPAATVVSARAGMTLHRRALPTDDVCRAKGLPAVRIERALAEVCARRTLTEAVVVVDGALHSGRLRSSPLQSWILNNPRFHRLASLRRAMDFVEPKTESPMESRLRMVLVLGGLPRPQAQVSIHDRWGRFIGRPDLYYEEARLGIEYDGGTHRDSMAEDNRRQNKLVNEGIRLLRFTASDVLGNPQGVVAQVGGMLEPNSNLHTKRERA